MSSRSFLTTRSNLSHERCTHVCTLSRSSIPIVKMLIYTDIVQFDGMKVTVEGVRDGVQRLSPVMEKIAATQTKQGGGLIRMQDRLNAIYRFLQDGLLYSEAIILNS